MYMPEDVELLSKKQRDKIIEWCNQVPVLGFTLILQLEALRSTLGSERIQVRTRVLILNWPYHALKGIHISSVGRFLG